MLIRSTKGFVCGGFTSVPWTKAWSNRRDPDAFLFGLTGGKSIFRPDNSWEAVFHHEDWGPFFSAALGIGGSDRMNTPMNGRCYTGKTNTARYNVPEDDSGNSVLTGDGAGEGYKRFTVADYEVFLVK